MMPSQPPKPSDKPRDATALVPGTLRRYAALFVVFGLGITLVGFLRGISAPVPLEKPALSIEKSSNVPAAPSYAEVPTSKIRANAGRESSLHDLVSPRANPFDPVIRTDEMKWAALASRAQNRAYDMAPPVIPHAIDQFNSNNCLACHSQGLQVGDKIATKVSHPHFTNCTQCHVEAARSQSALPGLTAWENDFLGMYRAGAGSRAWPGAPPTIPHTTWMRQDCTSCHGLVARPGIRTTHPWLTNCTQCHVPSASLDQVNFTGDKP